MSSLLLNILDFNLMKRYYIQSFHDVYVDDYENGEGKHVNSYDIDAFIRAENPKEAINLFLKNSLYTNMTFDDNCEVDENGIQLDYCVDADNNTVTNEDVFLWKDGKKDLYNNHAFITISQLTEITNF